jgi:hypothetical protein
MVEILPMSRAWFTELDATRVNRGNRAAAGANGLPVVLYNIDRRLPYHLARRLTMSKSRLSHDQKRKAKLAQRSKKHPTADHTPYTGRKYQATKWTPYVFETERAIYEVIYLTQPRLTNEQVRAGLIMLIDHLHLGQPAPLPEGAAEFVYKPGNEAAFVAWNIRRHWSDLFKEMGPVSSHDLTGILRTLLNSIEAHSWNMGPDKGYLAFLEEFMENPVY